jgi:hypothetical protein
VVNPIIKHPQSLQMGAALRLPHKKPNPGDV